MIKIRLIAIKYFNRLTALIYIYIWFWSETTCGGMQQFGKKTRGRACSPTGKELDLERT